MQCIHCASTTDFIVFLHIYVYYVMCAMHCLSHMGLTDSHKKTPHIHVNMSKIYKITLLLTQCTVTLLNHSSLLFIGNLICMCHTITLFFLLFLSLPLSTFTCVFITECVTFNSAEFNLLYVAYDVSVFTCSNGVEKSLNI